NPDVPQNLSTWTQGIMIGVMSSFSCLLTGIDPLNQTHQCLSIDPKTNKLGYVLPTTDNPKIGGVLGVTTNLIAATYTHPPASTMQYLSYMGSKFGIGTYAATSPGSGFTGLAPLMNIWVAF